MATRALVSKYGPAAVGTYTCVTTVTFASIYGTLSCGYDAMPLVLGVVDKAACAGVDLRPWLARVGALDDDGAPNAKFQRGSTFFCAVIIAKLFVPVKVPVAAALTPTVARLVRRWYP